jgi:hypothetical protein
MCDSISRGVGVILREQHCVHSKADVIAERDGVSSSQRDLMHLGGIIL